MERSHRTVVTTATTTLIAWFSPLVVPVVLVTELPKGKLSGVAVLAALAAHRSAADVVDVNSAQAD